MRRSRLLVVVAAMLMVAVITLTHTACTDNYRAKSMGGTMTIQLPPGQRLVNVTWKEKEIWYLSRPRVAGEDPITWTFKEKSDLGIQEGTVILQER
jgi:hypothetical protein